jgi:hypothetical protein
MSTTMEKIAVSCPQCGQQLLVPGSAVGKQGRCPSCKHIFPLEAPVAAQVIEPPPPPQAPNSIWDEMSSGDYTLQPLPPSPATSVSPNPYIPPAAQASKGRYQHGFGLEHRALNAGMMGGLGMMAVAAIWFFLGLYLGRIFFYPPILFILGLIGFFRGLFSGNVSGG